MGSAWDGSLFPKCFHFDLGGRAKRLMASVMRRFASLSGRRVVGAWWLFGLLGASLAALCPEPLRTVVSGIVAFILFASWIFGYPLMLVFFTPHARPSRSVRVTAALTVAFFVAILAIGSHTDSGVCAVLGFVSLIFLFSIGAHVLGTAEHRLGLYGPVDSFFAVVAIYCWPIGGVYIQNRLRRVATLDVNTQR